MFKMMIVGLMVVLNLVSFSRYEVAEVKEVINDEVIVEDTKGNIWSFYGDGFIEGETDIIRFDTKGTEEIFDDEIIDIQETGF